MQRELKYSQDKNKLIIDFLFHFVQYFNTFQIKKINIPCILWFNVSRLFILHTYHKPHCILIHHFHLLHFYPFKYTYPKLFIPSQVKCTNKKRYHLSLIFWALALLFPLILPHISWLQPRNEGLHFILSDNDNYYFDVKVRRWGFMGFVNYVIDYGCLGCVFCFRIKEKEKDKFNINFYSIIFLQSFYFYFLFLITSIE